MPASKNLSRELIRTARDLAHGTRRPGRPRGADLRRAVSTAYYAMFHALCECCANALHGNLQADSPQRAWRRTYRAVEHGRARNSCQRLHQNGQMGFPQDIADFANTFTTLQERRHAADYDPEAEFRKENVLAHVAAAQAAVEKLNGSQSKHRAAFASFVLFSERSR